MKNNTILTVVGKDISMDDLAKTLESIRAMSARAAIMVIGELPPFPTYAIGVPPYGISDVPVEWQEELASVKTALHEKVEEIETLLEQHDVAGEVTSATGDLPTIARLVSQKALFSDMALVGDDLRKSDTLFHQTVHSLLFDAPVGMLLNDPHATAISTAKRVLIAWNTQLHSARAVHQALPILKQSQEVIVATFDPVISEFGEGQDPGVDIAKWLTQHGCNVVVQQYPSGGKGVGECILSRAKEAGAELIVMGAYGHSRTRQALFGGTTRTMIDQTSQAVLLAH